MRSRWFQLSRVAVPTVFLGVVACVAVCGEIAHAQGILAGEAVARESVDLRPRTVAVFPFVNISGQPDDDWIGAGIAETVTADLEQFGELSVVGHEAFLDVLSNDRPDAALAVSDEALARDLARGLGVSWIVTGGFQRLGDQLRITARIVSVETGTAHETVKVDGRIPEMFTLQDRIVAELSGGLGAIARRGAPSMTAARRPSAGSQTELSQGEAATDPTVALRAAPPARTPGDAPSSRAGRSGSNGNGNKGAPAAAVNGSITIGDRPPQFAAASVAGNAGALAGRVTVRPVRTETPPTVDGRLDDAVWQDAARITEFVQRQPVDGAPATEDTDVYLAYDSSNIYLAFHVKYQDPAIMRASRVDRDQARWNDDLIRVYFDTFLDQQRAYVFSVNGYGVQGDST